VNFVTGKIHIWAAGKRTLCYKWICGSPDDPAETAVFSSKSTESASKSASNCKCCFTAKLGFKKLEEQAAVADDETVDSDEFEDE
jgi:hypothetical protein